MKPPHHSEAVPARPAMTKTRLEALSDGVIAIIITIMVLELRTPEGTDLKSLVAIAPLFGMYAMSFIHLGIYWNNHHHMLSAVRQVNGGVLWANLFLLFWLSLIPFTTRWMGESGFNATWPMAVYGASFLMPALAYTILSRTLIGANGSESQLARAVGRDVKGYASLAIYITGIALTFWQPLAGFACYLVVTFLWLVPDRRIEKKTA